MNVYACKGNRLYGAGMIFVTANSTEEAYETFINARAYKFLHKTFDLYPKDKWYQVTEMFTNKTEPAILEEDSYIYAE